jgi:hypothetical protein
MIYERDIRLDFRHGAEGIMTTGRIHDPEGAKTIVILFKSAAGAILAIQRHTFKIVRFNDSGRLRVNPNATAGGN